MRVEQLLVVSTALVLGGCRASPQLFPFSSLHNYFQHATRGGPGHEAAAAADAGVTASDASPAESEPAARRAPARPPPLNHRPAPEVFRPQPQAAFPSQVLLPPAPPVVADYATLLAAAAATATPPFRPSPVDAPVAPPAPAPSLVLVPPPLSTPAPTLSAVKIVAPPKLATPAPPLPPNHKPFPKKYRPEAAKASPKAAPAGASPDFVGKRKNASARREPSKEPSKEQVQSKQQQRQRQHVAATVEAAAFQPRGLPSGGLPREQEVAESGFAGVAAGVGGGHFSEHGGSSDRVEFQMHGQHGPHSYKWGYDTGKGHNRQFRYEERDTHGHVKGHYGFYDKSGKLQVVSYSADPEHGYHADGNFGKHSIA